ncbi:MAG TPA: GTP-binding protein [Mycobacteriales bacterium]|nr:GTP-binding protein [Mycobacteriales bacterium]
MDPDTDNGRSSVPCIIVSAPRAELRDECCWAILRDVPAARTVRYDVVTLPGGRGFRRTISDSGCLVDQHEIDVTTHCMTCAIRIDLLVTLDRLRRRRAPIIVGLPVGTNVSSVVAALDGGVRVEPELSPADVRSVVLAVDAKTVVDDLTGADQLVDRGQHWEDTDRRSVGEVLAASIDFADRILVDGDSDPDARGFLSHLAGARVSNGQTLDGRRLLRATRDPRAAYSRIDPLKFRPDGDTALSGAWTLDLASWRPIHPERLHRRLADLAIGRLRGRGRFWLPTRPDTVCIWDNAGAQLSIGDGGDWREEAPSTRLVITGIDATDRDRILGAFETTLMTDSELVRGLANWIGRDDGLDTWLGSRTTVT